MSENEFFSGSPKTMFFSGFVAGIAVVAVITSLYLANITFSDTSLLAQAEQDQVVDVGTDDPVAEQPNLSTVPALNEDDNYLGNKDASVVLIEYSDIQCPFCFRHHPTMQQVVEEFGDDVVWVYRHFPLSFHPEAVPSAVATECAGEQGKFFDYLDVMVANQDSLADDFYLETATSLGLDLTAWQVCVDSGVMEDKIADQMSAGAAAGVKGTPATFINGQLVSGAVPYETFKTVIELELE
ncbi:MAG: thioredoxin domain-containing protein [Candidatus Uhrbacteria bacterium]